MAKLIIKFEEIGGITEFNGIKMHLAEPLIINKAADYLMDTAWAGIDNEEDFINYRLTYIDWPMRTINFHIQLNLN